jgi:hypothetical protein
VRLRLSIRPKLWMREAALRHFTNFTCSNAVYKRDAYSLTCTFLHPPAFTLYKHYRRSLL